MPARDLPHEILVHPDSELRRLAAAGNIPMPLADLLALQVALTADADAAIAEEAHRGLKGTDPRIVSRVIDDDAAPEVVGFFGAESREPVILEAVIRRRDVDPGILEGLAERLPEELQEVLLLRQDAIVEHPAIVEALERNPRLVPRTARRIAEYREHLLGSPEGGAGEAQEVTPAAAEEALVTEVHAVYEAAEREAESGEVGRVARLTEAEIRSLPVPIRMKLTRGAPRMLRAILVRDQHREVALSVLRNNRMTDGEIEQIVRSRSVLEEVLDAIGSDRNWVRRPRVVLGLTRNPRSPRALAIRLLSSLPARQLRELARDRNVPDAVRNRALRLYTIKTR